MEEDIKILEELIKNEHGELLNCWDYGEEATKSLENLLTRYKQLEEKLDNSRKANELLNKTNNELRWGKRTAYSKAVNDIISKFNLGDDYIPKSKIKEKIEELEQENNETYIKFLESDRSNETLSTKGKMLQGGIEVLQELLEEE